MAGNNPDTDQLMDALGELFGAMKRPQRWLEITRAAGVQLDRPAGLILRVLSDANNTAHRVQDIAQLLHIEAPSVTRKTQELEKLGLVARTQNERDKRAVDLQITPAGRQITQKLYQVQLDEMDAILSSWPTDDRQSFIRLLSAFSAALNNNQHYA